MRRLFLSAALGLAWATAAAAAPASVSVSIAPKLQKTFTSTYGQREADRLTQDLKSSVEKALERSSVHSGARIELVLADAVPNRPTFKQLGDKPGLSPESFGVGGAKIEGRIISADGRETPIRYSWYETDISQAYGNWVWSDATWTFDRFARRLARGQDVAQR